MQKVRTWFRRIWYRLRKDFFTVQNIVLIIAFVLSFAWTTGAITTMTKNWQLQKKLQARQIDLEKLRLEVETLQLEQKYFESEEYLELMARSKGGKMLEGETMVILPENSESAKTKYDVNKKVEESQKSNFSEWLDFLFG